MRLEISDLVSGQQRYKIITEVIVREFTNKQLDADIVALQTELAEKLKIKQMIVDKIMGIIT